MKADIEISDEEIKIAVVEYLKRKTGLDIVSDDVQIQSKGGYFGENWRVFPMKAAFTARVKDAPYE